MRKLPQHILDLPLEERAFMALKAAVRKAIAERKRAGVPVYVWKAGKVVDLTADRRRSPRSGKARGRRS